MTQSSNLAVAQSPRRPMVIGHRGASGYRPEHSAAAYREAIAQGADAVEPDIVVSRDGILVIRHETEISSTTDIASRPEFAHRKTVKWVDGTSVSGWFAEDFDWAELQSLRVRERLPEIRRENAEFDGTEQILSLRELFQILEEADRPVSVVIEIKHAASLMQAGHDIVTLLMSELNHSGWISHQDRIVIESFDLDPLLRLRGVGVSARTVFLLESAGAPFDQVLKYGDDAASFAWYRTNEGLDWLAGRVSGVSVAKRDLLKDPQLVRRTHARELQIFVWTLRPENRFLTSEFRANRNAADWGDWRTEWTRIIETGVDGVFVDHPRLMVELLDDIRPGK